MMNLFDEKKVSDAVSEKKEKYAKRRVKRLLENEPFYSQNLSRAAVNMVSRILYLIVYCKSEFESLADNIYSLDASRETANLVYGLIILEDLDQDISTLEKQDLKDFLVEILSKLDERRKVEQFWSVSVIEDDGLKKLITERMSVRIDQVRTVNLGGQGAGVLYVKLHQIYLANREILEVVEKCLDSSNRHSEHEVKFYSISATMVSGQSDYSPKVFFIEKISDTRYSVFTEYIRKSTKLKLSATRRILLLVRGAAECHSELYKLSSNFDRVLLKDKISTLIRLLNSISIERPHLKPAFDSIIQLLDKEDVIEIPIVQHCDLHMRNIVFCDRNKIRLIDWGAVREAPLGLDLQLALWPYVYRIQYRNKDALRSNLLNLYFSNASFQIEEARFKKDSLFNYAMFVSAISWLCRNLKKEASIDELSNFELGKLSITDSSENLKATVDALSYIRNFDYREIV